MLRYITRLLNMTEEEIINHPNLLVNVLDHDHYVLFWNKQCEQLFGIKEEEALGRRLEDILPSSRTNQKMSRLQNALSGETVYIEDDIMDSKDYYYSQVLIPIRNSNGKVIAAVNIVRRRAVEEAQNTSVVFSVFPDNFNKN